MNIQEYISSGIIESYVMGVASQTEREEFERLCKIHPELEEARRQFELSLEEKSMNDAVEPPPGIKERLMDAIRNEKASTLATIIELPKTEKTKTGRTGLYWTIAACLVLLAGCIGLIWFFYQKNSQLEAEMASIEKRTDSLDRKSQDLEAELLRDESLFKKVEFTYPQKSGPATINVYWDSTSTHVYLVLKGLAPLPDGQRYHLWAIMKEKRQSMGLFDAPKEDKLILKMDNVREAESFTITIEKPGDPAQIDSAISD